MIFPFARWTKWEPMRKRSEETHNEAFAVTQRQAGGILDPHQSAVDFMTAEDAFLNDTAITMGLSRSQVEQEAASGEIEWQQSFNGLFFTRRIHVADSERRMQLAQFNWNSETIEEWHAKIKALAAQQP